MDGQREVELSGIETESDLDALSYPHDSRPRARKKKRKGKSTVRRDQRSDRVRHIMRLLAGSRWVTGVTDDELASRWKVHHGTIQSYVGEASRAIRERCIVDPDLKCVIESGIQDISKRAHALAKSAEKAGKFGEAGKCLSVALDGLKAFADVSGAKAATKLEVNSNLGELIAAAAKQEAEELERSGDGSTPAPPVDD